MESKDLKETSFRLNSIKVHIFREGHKNMTKSPNFFDATKGQLISKANCQAVNSSKKRTNEFVFTSMRRVFVRLMEEIEDSKKAFRNYLTFK